MNVDILLDTNIVIYLSQGNQKYIEFLTSFAGKRMGISIITYIEILVGIDTSKHMEEIREILQGFTIIPLEEDISYKAALTMRSRKRTKIKDPKFADIVIAQTAIIYDIPLITNNPKDFASFEELKMIVPK